MVNSTLLFATVLLSLIQPVAAAGEFGFIFLVIALKVIFWLCIFLCIRSCIVSSQRRREDEYSAYSHQAYAPYGGYGAAPYAAMPVCYGGAAPGYAGGAPMYAADGGGGAMYTDANGQVYAAPAQPVMVQN